MFREQRTEIRDQSSEYREQRSAGNGCWLFAAPLSIGLANGIYTLLPFKEMMSFEYPLLLLGVGLESILVVAALASISPALMAARKTVSDILRYQ